MGKIEEIAFDNFESLINELEKLGNKYFFRGMASDQWKLKTSIDRFLEEIKKNNDNILLEIQTQNVFAEFRFLSEFIEKCKIDINKILGNNENFSLELSNDNFLKLVVILQHYGLPTRVLDWTTNWEKALYFCLEDENQKENCCIWAVQKSNISDVEKKIIYSKRLKSDNKMKNFFGDLNPGVYLINEDNYIFERIKSQNGIALVCGLGNNMNFEDHLLSIGDAKIKKIKIDKMLRPEIGRFLIENNINKKTLYPDDLQENFINETSINNVKQATVDFIQELYPNDE
ncbi:MAG TPA: hypothetical protein DHW82_11280 [Spirochaetia bacterium]|nr:MAG: hypothetical protein A2Y41_02650 [Spirochaetes bacterium GWB1_36_13]HCL57573.1 hypothetical protein [Spirochaetia bacterium]